MNLKLSLGFALGLMIGNTLAGLLFGRPFWPSLAAGAIAGILFLPCMAVYNRLTRGRHG